MPEISTLPVILRVLEAVWNMKSADPLTAPFPPASATLYATEPVGPLADIKVLALINSHPNSPI